MAVLVQQIYSMNKISLLPSLAYNFTAQYNSNSNGYSLVLSPSASLLAHLDSSDVYVFNTSSKQLLTKINFSAVSALFGIADDSILLTDSYSLRLFHLDPSKKGQTIISPQQNNQISSLLYSPNYKSIYFLNHTFLGQYASSSITVPSLNASSCQMKEIAIDKSSEVLISSSFDCNLCSFAITNNNLQLKKSNKIPRCRIGSLSIIDGNIALTQDTITSKYPQIVYVDGSSLQVIAHYNQSSTNLSLQVVHAQNYIISFGTTDNFLWIYRNAFNTLPNQVFLPFNVLTASLTANNQIAYLSLNQSSSQLSLTSYSFSFNCSAIPNTVNTSNSYAQGCTCKAGMLFDSSNLACKKMQCANTPSSPCHCPVGQSFDSFKLSCTLNCSAVYDSLLPASYGEPSRCSCRPPYQWNAPVSDCSLIDCSLIPKARSTSISSSCLCSEGYEWDDSTLNCSVGKASVQPLSSSSDSHVGLIIGLIFAFLVILLSAVIYYYKKYKKSPEDEPKNYEYPRRQALYEHQPTPRPLAFENNIKTSVQLREVGN